MAVKQTPHLIPMCHPILIDEILLQFDILEQTNRNNSYCNMYWKNRSRNGSYDRSICSCTTLSMICVNAEKGIKIDNIRLVKKAVVKAVP